MTPNRVAVKNFLTFGEALGGPVEFVFTADEPLWVLCGANGTGKSAVFDAITYALYGEHRGGKQKAEQLIRHGTNGFEIEIDFTFGGTEYRIRRTRQRKPNRTTQHLLKKTEDEWACVRGGDLAGAVDAADLKAWVTDTLGLNYEAFTNSVLLKQGEADKLFDAGRDDRIAVLKGIIGFEQFEALSSRVGEEAKAQASSVDNLLSQRNTIDEVSDDALSAAETALRIAEAARAAAQEVFSKAGERVTNARQWEKLEAERRDIDAKIAAADERQTLGRQIRTDKKALDDLTVAVPVLESLFALRARLAALDAAYRAADQTATTKAEERDAARDAARESRERAASHKARAAECAATTKDLAAEIKQGHAFLIEAKAIAKLNEQLDEYPDDLDARFDAATATETDANASAQQARAAQTRADTLLTQAEEQQTRFAGVTVGVPCPHCRRPVDEGHAATVRAELADTIETLQLELTAANTAVTGANARLATATAERKRREKERGDRDNLVTKRDAKRESLTAHGVTGDAATLHAALTTLDERRRAVDAHAKVEAAAEKTEATEVKRLEAACDTLDTEAKTAEKERAKHDTDRATARGQEQTTLAQLSDEWSARLPNTDSAVVAGLAASRARLAASGITERFRELEQDETRRTEWECRRAAVGAEIDGIPFADRHLETDAKRQQASAEKDAKEKAAALGAAGDKHKKLTDDRTRRDALTLEHCDAAERHRLLAKLDKLLGEAGLQRELVRDAEEQIVAFANETLHHLSDGDLSLEEDTAADSTKTFDLRVRRGGGEPIGVAFLSGSQRFRVAVSVALAVGRFASGRARPLEAVIIDEGFGSLDPLGLRAMAAELKRLQQAGALQRVILVSHQPDFSDQFSVGYALVAGDAGTTASAFRR